MIGCFPGPLPDESLHSVCARFHGRLRCPNAKAVLNELFGPVSSIVAVDLPCNLGRLVAELPPGHQYTTDQLINDHTLFPLVAPFLPPERALHLREDMRGAGGLFIHKRSGLMASRVPDPEYLHFCPACNDEDRRDHGETYWHRLHQVPGVLVCPTHLIFLENSNVRRGSARSHPILTSAEDGTEPRLGRRLNLLAHDDQVLLRIARDSAWLLKHPTDCSTPENLYNRYLRVLIERGLATYTGSIHVVKLLNDFSAFYSPEVMGRIHCEFTGSDQVKTNWLLRLARPPKHVQHPLYHLLLMQFLGYTPEEFFRLPTNLNIFGEGPWPCLNPAAEHFREPVISEFKLSPRLRYGRPTTTFSCGCGFAYARSGPDSTQEDRFRVGRIISFGPIWEAKLKDLWKDSSLSLSEVGRQLGVDTLAVRRHASRLKISSSRPGKKFKPLNHAAQLKGTPDSTAHVEKRRDCRTKWVSATQQAPKTTLKSLRRKLPREYVWLLQNDAGWLKNHSPRHPRSARSTSSVDWKRRDAEYAVAVRAAAASLKNHPGRLVQITKTAIGRNLGAVKLLQQKLSKMPFTAQVLASVVETREEYAARRIWWAANLFCRENISPEEWQLVRRANVLSLEANIEVKSTIKLAISMIRSKLPEEQVRQAVS